MSLKMQSQSRDAAGKKKRGPAPKANKMIDTHVFMPEDLLEWMKQQPEGFAGLVRRLGAEERERRQVTA